MALSLRRRRNPSNPSKTMTVVEHLTELRFRLVVSPDGADGSITIHQDARLYLASLLSGESVSQKLEPGRAAWLQVLEGSVKSFENALVAGDGVAITDENQVAVHAAAPSEVLLFDLA